MIETKLVAIGAVVLSTGRRVPLDKLGPEGEMLTRPETRDVPPGGGFTMSDPAEVEALLRCGGAALAGSDEAAEAIRRAREGF